MIVFPARSRGALRGYSIDRLILDEAQYLTQAQLEAALPTMSARSNTQMWLFGTPPTQIGDGEVLSRLRVQAMSGHSFGVERYAIAAKCRFGDNGIERVLQLERRLRGHDESC